MPKFRLLILKEAGLSVSISDDIRAWRKYEEEEALGIELEIDQRRVDFPNLKHESFGISWVSEGKHQDMYGLTAIKDRVRPIVKEGEYDAVIFIYDIADTELYRKTPDLAKQVGNWCYFNPLYPGCPFIEVVSKKSWNAKDPFRVFSHEWRHALVFRIRALGYAILDLMDSMYVVELEKWMPYYKEYEPYAKDGNRAAQNLLLRTYIDILAARPERRSLLERLQAQLAALMNNIAPMPADPTRLVKWAEAIKKHEGWYVGSRSQRNLNPGNFKLTSYIKSLGALARGDAGNFAIFPTYDAGWRALLAFLKDAQANSLISYRNFATARDAALRKAGKPEGPKDPKGRSICTIYDFYQVYAPTGDNVVPGFTNDPNAYANQVAKAIGLPVSTPINLI